MDAIEQLELLAKGSFPPKRKGDDDDEDTPDASSQDDAPGDDAAPPDADDETPPGEMGDSEDGDSDPDAGDSGDADGDGDGVPDGADSDDDPDGSDGDDAPGSFAELDADGDGDIDADDAALDPSAGGAGDLGALATQLIEAERNYYAAVGHKGHANHNTVRLLEDFHKVLRKFVRAATSGQAQDDAAPPQDDADGDGSIDGDQQVPGKGPPPPAAARGDADGDGIPDDEDDDPHTPKKVRRAMEKGYRAFGAKHGHEVLVGVEPLAIELRKGMWDFRDSEAMAEIPEQFYMPYLVAFIEAAYNDCCRGTDMENSPEKSAAAIMLRLVTLLPKASNLRKVATKYAVTEKGIVKILKDKGIISLAQAAADQYLTGTPTDSDSMRALGAEEFARSDNWARVSSLDLHAGDSRLTLVDRARPVQIVDDRVMPMQVGGFQARFHGRNELAKATVSSVCRIHSPVDLRKTDTLTHAFAKCTCPR